jgi:hypothetical protein
MALSFAGVIRFPNFLILVEVSGLRFPSVVSRIDAYFYHTMSCFFLSYTRCSEHLVELLEMSSPTDRLVGELGRLPPTPLPVEPATWSSSFETSEMRLDASAPSLLMICGGAMSPETVHTRLHEMGESHVDYLFWVFDASLYCVPCGDDPTQMRLAKDIEDFHAFVRDNLSTAEAESPITIVAIFSNRRKACELLTKTPIRVCFPGSPVCFSHLKMAFPD